MGGENAEPQDAPSQNNYYQKLVYAALTRNAYTFEGFEVLARQLAAIARHAYLAKQLNAVEQASQVILALPIRAELKAIGLHYQALCTWCQGYSIEARQSLERVAEQATSQFRARALQDIGLTYQQNGEVDTALRFYFAAGRAAATSGDLLTFAQSQQMIAVVRSIHADHKEALAELQKLFPLVRALAKEYPAPYYDFLNSLAVELGEVGRISEAESALSIALASPFAAAYPVWGETRDELAAKRQSATPSVVAINRAPEPAASPQAEPKPKTAARVVSIWHACYKTSFQRTVNAIAARPAIRRYSSNSIFDRMLTCIAPRAPPVSRR
jgi:hypothetical protein